MYATPQTLPLYVPLQLDVLLVNDQARAGQAFQRWRPNFDNLARFMSPEPDAFDGNTAADWRNDPSANGAYLHWTLPWGLRNGTHENPDGSPVFPLAPNRWLVMRCNGAPGARKATAWVIESDYVATDGSVSFVDPFAATPEATYLGRATPVARWSEAGGQMFLTALGPGDPTFTAYQPNVDNVFSFHDPLAGVSDQDTLSYLVAGWYSDPGRDVLADLPTGCTTQQLMSRLGWDVPETGAAPEATVCHGMSYGLAWDRTGPPPPSRRPTRPGEMTVAVGNTAIDAVTALVASLPDISGLPIDPAVLEAFQYGLLARYADPAVHGELWRAIHAAWFAEEAGGSIWRIVDAPIDAGSATGEEPDIDEAELQKEDIWLAALNRAQQDYDVAAATLLDLQRQLYDLWWKSNAVRNLPIWPAYPDGVTAGQFADALDPHHPHSLVRKVYMSARAAATLRDKIPWGMTEGELEASAEAYAAGQDLPASRRLLRAARDSFFAANNPVVLIAGLNNPASSQPDSRVWCRLPDELVQGFTYKSTLVDIASMKGAIPTPPLRAVPAMLGPLADEFFFLDPANAQLVATVALGDVGQTAAVAQVMAAHQALDGVAPDSRVIPLLPWTQPWSPLYLMWSVDWYPIAFEGTGGPNWSFDGEEYGWNGSGAELDRRTGLSGRIFLTPNVQFNMRARIEEYLRKHPSPPLHDIDRLLESVERWDLLSQSLDGFQQQLAQRQPLSSIAPFASQVLFKPHVTLADLIGGAPRYAPDPGAYERPPFQPWPPSIFEGLRAGQFHFTRLMVVDAFGQTAEIVNSSNQQQFAPVLAPGVTPQHPVLPVSADRFVQLPPRLQQPARLDFTFVSNVDDTRLLDFDAGVNPVAAWVLPNHLDAGLLLFGPAGEPLGEMRLAADPRGAAEAIWTALPGSPYPTVASLAPDYPIAAAMLGQFQTSGGTADFTAFLSAIDSTLWSVDPLGARDDQSLSVMVGRPLAIARARLKFEILGAPITDPSWRFTFAPRPADYLDSTFSVSLGNASIERDGLIGYFVGSDYATFHASQPPDNAPPYIQPIAPGTYIEQNFEPASQSFVTLLMDPRAEVNAYSGVTPAVQIELPQPMVNAALAAMEVMFSVGPMLSDTTIVEPGGAATGEPERRVSMPLPSARAGRWTWVAQQDGLWEEYPILPAGPAPQLSTVPPELRTGLLKLSGALGRGAVR